MQVSQGRPSASVKRGIMHQGASLQPGEGGVTFCVTAVGVGRVTSLKLTGGRVLVTSPSL